MNASGTNGARKPKRSESAALAVSLPGLTRSRACPTSALNVEIGNIRFRCNPVPPGRWLLDRPVNPPIKSGEGDDSGEVSPPRATAFPRTCTAGVANRSRSAPALLQAYGGWLFFGNSPPKREGYPQFKLWDLTGAADPRPIPPSSPSRS